MKIPQLNAIKSKEQARELAIDWQNWAWDIDLSYSELAEWQDLFYALARKYHLIREFKENGII